MFTLSVAAHASARPPGTNPCQSVPSRSSSPSSLYGLAYFVTTPAAAQRAVGGYADHDFRTKRSTPADTGSNDMRPIRSNEAQKIMVAASLESLIGGGNPSSAAYSASDRRAKRALQRTVISPGCLRTGKCVRRTRSARLEPDLSAPRGRL